MSKLTKRVYKDFASLEVAKRIELSALGLLQIVHKGEKHLQYKPRKGTQIYRVWNMGKLDYRQQRAWAIFRRDFDTAEGVSGGVTSAYGEYKDNGGNSQKTPTSYTNVSYNRIDRLVSSFLTRDESILLRDLLKDDLQSSSDVSLEFIGLIRSGYKDDDNARTSGVTHVQNLMSKLAAYYGL